MLERGVGGHHIAVVIKPPYVLLIYRVAKSTFASRPRIALHVAGKRCGAGRVESIHLKFVDRLDFRQKRSSLL